VISPRRTRRFKVRRHCPFRDIDSLAARIIWACAVVSRREKSRDSRSRRRQGIITDNFDQLIKLSCVLRHGILSLHGALERGSLYPVGTTLIRNHFDGACSLFPVTSAASNTDRIPVRKMPSKVPAPPIDATGAPSPCILSRFRMSAPINVPRLPAM
jgi:hypothetical protein